MWRVALAIVLVLVFAPSAEAKSKWDHNVFISTSHATGTLLAFAPISEAYCFPTSKARRGHRHKRFWCVYTENGTDYGANLYPRYDVLVLKHRVKL